MTYTSTQTGTVINSRGLTAIFQTVRTKWFLAGWKLVGHTGFERWWGVSASLCIAHPPPLSPNVGSSVVVDTQEPLTVFIERMREGRVQLIRYVQVKFNEQKSSNIHNE